MQKKEESISEKEQRFVPMATEQMVPWSSTPSVFLRRRTRWLLEALCVKLMPGYGQLENKKRDAAKTRVAHHARVLSCLLRTDGSLP